MEIQHKSEKIIKKLSFLNLVENNKSSNETFNGYEDYK